MVTSSELRDYATVIAATIAVLVFVVNSLSMMRNRRIENLSRFNQAYQWPFVERGYIARNLAAIEAGTLQRDRGDAEMEARFHLMLLDVEASPSSPTTERCRATPRFTCSARTHGSSST